MGWETRRPGGPKFYVRARKVHGRLVREYLGIGPQAEAAAVVDALRRAERQAAVEARRAERLRLQEADAPLQDLEEVLRLLIQATLVANGYYRHGGEWRRNNDISSRGKEG